ncbi:MAG: hypothetical protein QOG41_1693 [Thermoleophilaceae bacterium]|nr:hypothetical protein [Thermoleophilaceae bacterium]
MIASLAHLRRRLRSESGIALPIALMIAGLMLGLGLAIAAYADQQTLQTGTERVKENSLTLSEGALNAQANLLASNWPSSSANAFGTCTQVSTSTACPDPGNLLRGFTNSDFTSSSWAITIRDNGLGAYYDDTATASQPAYDASGPAGGGADNLVWLRAQATVRGRTRVIVALLRAFPVGQNFPRGVVTAGSFATSNNGKKAMVDPGTGPGVMVRCTPGAGAPQRGDTCMNFVATKGQVWPPAYKSDTTLPSAMPAADIATLKARAQAAGTYYATCPATLPSAPLVYIETGGCSYTGSQSVNSPTSPGMLLVYTGGISFGGTMNFYGIVYAVNNANSSSANLVDIGGNAQISGAVVVDGNGGVTAGSSKTNIVYDPNVFNVVSANATVNIVANSWRELNGH